MRNLNRKKILNIFYDTEVYNITSDKPIDFPNVTKVFINLSLGYKRRIHVNNRPYAIGWLVTTEEFEKARFEKNMKFIEGKHGQVFLEFGLNCVNKFIQYIESVGLDADIYLHAFNQTYDFHQILPYFQKKFGDRLNVKSSMGGAIQVSGEMSIKYPKTKKKIKIKLIDLWQWDKNMSLAKWISLYEKHYEKQKIDYNKWDFVFDDSGYPLSYCSDKNHSRITFNEKLESKYLKEDLIWLPIIKKDISYQRTAAIAAILENLNIKITPKDKFFLRNAATQASFFKMMNNIILRHEQGRDDNNNAFDDLYRIPCGSLVFQQQKASRLGGFTSGGLIDKMEDRFALMIDVNSMYPFIISQGVPFGELTEEKPKDNYVTWYLIEGRTDPKWRDKYNVFDNTFLGKNFFKRPYFQSHKSEDCLWYMHKDLYDVMSEMCEHNFRVVGEYYQPKGYHMSKFISECFKLKNKYSSIQAQDEQIRLGQEVARAAAKTGMNSMYGKILESSHDDSLYWDNKLGQYVMPEISIVEERGDLREALPGVHITSASRVMLLRTIKRLIDNGCTFLYCDTDSITFIPNGPKSWAFIHLHETELGAWSLERVINCFLYSGKRKRYHMRNTRTVEETAAAFPTLKITKETIKPKSALSGFDPQMIDDLSWKQACLMFDRRLNFLVRDARTAGIKDNLTYKRYIKSVDAEFNPGVRMAGELKKLNTRWYMRLDG